MATKIRQLPTYVLHSVPKKPIIRQLPTYVLHGVDAALPRGVTGKTAVFNRIQEEALQALTIDMLEISDPEVSTEFNRNTKVLVTGAYGSGLLGTMYFYYNRAVLKRLYLKPSLNGGGSETAHDMIARLQLASDMLIETRDLLNTSVEGGGIHLVASDTSYFFLPETTKDVVFT